MNQMRNSHLIAHKYIWKNYGENIMLSIQVGNQAVYITGFLVLTEIFY